MMKILQILAIFLVMVFTSQCSQEEVQNIPNDSSLNNEMTNANKIKDALMAKAATRIDALRPEVASSVFDAEAPEEEEVSDEQPNEEDE